MIRIEARQTFDAEPETVWEHLTDHEGMPRWMPLAEVRLSREGTDHRNGTGATRVMRGAGPPMIEEVIAWEPPTRYRYALRKGAPVRDHEGTVELRPSGSGTEVTWSVGFRPALPGTGRVLGAVLRVVLQRALRKLAGQLARRA